MDTTIKTEIKVLANRHGIFIYDKCKREIILIEIGITNQDILQNVEAEKATKYELLANELSLLYKCKAKVIPYIMTWDGVVMIYHRK